MAHPWEVGDHNQRWKGYMHPVYDLTLCTKLGEIETPGALRKIEDQYVEARAVTLAMNGIPGSYDLEGLRSIHRHLFQDVYEWAGDLRTVEMGSEGVAALLFFQGYRASCRPGCARYQSDRSTPNGGTR